MAEQIHGHMPPALDVEDVLADPAGACPDCVRIVVERLHATLTEDPDRAQLLHELDVQRAAMATMLADERQMQAAHDRTRAELDAARAEVERLRAELAEARDTIADPATGYIARLARTKVELDDLAAQNAKTEDNFRDFAEDALAVQRERDRLAEQVKQLRALVEEALHLRQNGECAPGGTETWHEWDLKAPTVLRALDGTEATP